MSGWDAIVVGAGPAGSAMAARLASRGRRVLLLDRAAFPRPKPCGECLSPAAVGALHRLGALPAIRALPHAPILGWRIRPFAGSAFGGDFHSPEPGIAIDRAALDCALLDHARDLGAEARTGTRVLDLVRERGRVAGVRTPDGDLHAPLVVGADGLRSVVSRRLGLLRRAPRLRKVALTAHVRGLAELGGRGELHLFPWGCVGMAEIGGGAANVTVVVPAGSARGIGGRAEEFFEAALATAPPLRGALRVGGVMATGPFDFPVRAAVADGALLVGDAAGYYDPFTGQGLYRALRGAELAAETADRALASGDPSVASLAPYDAARRAAFSAGERLQHAIEAFVSRPAILAPVSRLLANRPRLADTLIAVTGDLRPARSLLPALAAAWAR